MDVFDLGKLRRFVSTSVEDGGGEATIVEPGQQMRPARPCSADDERGSAHLGPGWVIEVVMCRIVAV